MIRVRREVYAEMLAHARGGYPLEVCGLLAGKDGEATALYRMTNTDGSGEHYTMDPREQFDAVRDMRARGMGLAGIYHSHPETPARPSDEDIRLAYTPGVSYVIISLMDREAPSAGSYRIKDGSAEAEGLEIM